jgi:hypothetical protein
MGGLMNIMIGYFFGFALGVGCALAVMYTIWTGGYKKAIEHSMMSEPPERYQSIRAAVSADISRKRAVEH